MVEVLSVGGYYGGLVPPYVYPHGLPFSEKIAENVDDLMLRIDNNKAAVLLVDGSVGYGKTTLVTHIVDYVNLLYGSGVPALLDGEHEQIAFGGEEFKEKLLLCHERRLLVLGYDEAGDFAKRGAMTRFNRNLMRVFEMYRGFKVLVVVALPRFYKLETELFELGVVRLLLHITERAKGYADVSGYDLEQMFYMKHWAKKLIVTPKCYDYGEVNFRGHFLDLPPERARALDEIGIAAKRRETRRTIADVKDRVSLPMIAKHFGKSERWCLLRIRELGGEEGEVKVFERRKWYDRKVLRLIEDLEG